MKFSSKAVTVVRLPAARGRPRQLFRRDLIVVLLSVDLTAGLILLMIDVLLFSRRERPAVGAAVGADLTVDVLFVIFGPGRLARRHLSAPDALGDALLLLVPALTHWIVAVLCIGGVVLVGVDGTAQIVLLMVDLLAFLRCQ